MDTDNSGAVSFEEFYEWWKLNKDRKSKGRFGKLSIFKRKGPKRSLFGKTLKEVESGADSFTAQLLASLEERCVNLPLEVLFAAKPDSKALSDIKSRLATISRPCLRKV